MSGGADGIVAISSPATGLTVRLIQDHKGAPITDMDIAPEKVNNEGKIRSAHSKGSMVPWCSLSWSRLFYVCTIHLYKRYFLQLQAIYQ